MAQNAARKAQAAKIPSISEINILPSQDCRAILEAAFTLLGVESVPKAIGEFLGDRSNYWQIVNWRRGRTRPSREVMDYIAMRLDERAANLEGLAVACRRLVAGVHQPNILAWNARRRS